MDRSVFEQHFFDAAVAARDFARTFIEEPLPDAMRFRVHLNSSYDGNAEKDFRLFPDDSSEERALSTKNLDAAGVIDLLWRDGYVPQWVDLQVVGEDGRTSVMDVIACGRFTDDEQRLYYANTPYAPFSPKGPSLPAAWVKGQRFSIYNRSSCWSIEDLEHVDRNAEKVWSLTLHGPVFSDSSLVRGPTFSRLEILELYGVAIRGEGLRGLARFPQLRHLRAEFGALDELSLADLPPLETLQTLSLTSLPPRLVHADRLAAAAPNLRELTLRSTHRTDASGVVSFEELQSLTLGFPALPSWVATPKSLRTLWLHLPEAADDQVVRLLRTCGESLESLGLCRTPVTRAILDELARFHALRYLDADDTQITMPALERFAASRPGLRCSPRLARDPVPTITMENGVGQHPRRRRRGDRESGELRRCDG